MARKTDQHDVEQLLGNMRSHQWRGELSLQCIGTQAPTSLSGTLFGGCFSVLTNLLGTPYFPKSLAGHILFLEDTGETLGRLLRFLNQWLQSGALSGVKAIILGNFRDLANNDPQAIAQFNSAFAERCQLPVFISNQFGHTSPNTPIAVGGSALIKVASTITLKWELPLASEASAFA